VFGVSRETFDRLAGGATEPDYAALDHVADDGVVIRLAAIGFSHVWSVGDACQEVCEGST
jgi:hypothetical protein